MFKLVNVSKVFDNNIKALNNFSYEFKSSGFYVIVGPSGSGKSTLLNLLACLDNEYQGMIYYQNKAINKRNRKHLRKRIGMIYQNSYLIPYLDVQDNISLNPKLVKEELIEKLGIKQLRKRNITKLSGGQGQRVSLARALAYNPIVILADEPTAALDQNNAHKVMGVLKKESANKLVIMVSHDFSLIKQYADKILYLNQGNLIKEEIINSTPLSKNIIKFKKRKKHFLKLVFSFLNYKKKSVILTSFCFVIGLLGIILSIILSEGFTNFFQKQFDNSLNSNIIYGYPETIDKVTTLSLIDTQNIALNNNLEWHLFYRFNEEVVNDVSFNKQNIEWLSVYDLFSFNYYEETELLDINSFALIFPLDYSFIFPILFNQELENATKINEYLLNNEVLFSFNFLEYKIELRLNNIIWTLNNKIEIIHNSHFFIEDLSSMYNFLIENDIESNSLIRYPYLIDVDEKTQENFYTNFKYRNYMFSFNNEYKGEDITLIYYATSPRISKEELENYLIYGGVSDYLYISQNGVNIEQKMPSLNFNDIEGKSISFYPICLDEENINKQFILYGNIPKNDNEIIVSYSLFKELKIKLNQSIKVSNENCNTALVNVVGYIEGNDAFLVYQKGSWTYSFFTNSLKMKVSELPCFQVSLLLNDKNIIPYYVSFFNGLDQNIDFVSPLYEANKEINKIINYFKIGIMVLSGFSVFVSILLIAVIIFINTIEQKKYDAILIMQGYSKNNIIFIHLLQNILISLISFFATLIISVLIIAEVNIIFSLMLGLSYYSFAILSNSLITKILIYSLLIAVCFTLLPLKFLSLNQPLKVLKE